MKIKKMVPIITSSKLKEVKEFYTRYLDFKVIFEMEDSYMAIASQRDPQFELGFMPPSPGQQQSFNGQGITCCFEVDDADAEYARLKSEGLEIIQEIQDNPWGDRSFIIRDPVGMAIYICHPIPPNKEYEHYHITENATG